MELVSGVGPGVRPVATSTRRPVEAVARLRDVADRVSPVTLAGDRRLEVMTAVGNLFPDGLQRGTTVGVRGPGATSLGMAVAVGPVAAGSWVGLVGCEDVCLVAAEQMGLALHRTVLVDQPPPSCWGAVVAALVDAFDVVVVGGSGRIRFRDARRLSSRARERGSVIIDIGGAWPDAPDVVLEATGQVWFGLGEGHGILTARQVTVKVSGRRGVRPREESLWLPDAGTAPTVARIGWLQEAPEATTHAGGDVDALVEVMVEAEPEHRLEAV